MCIHSSDINKFISDLNSLNNVVRYVQRSNGETLINKLKVCIITNVFQL